MNTENVSTLKIHKLTREQYERELGAGRIDPTAIYLTPNEELLSIEQGGTGANNAADALVNLGAAPAGYGLGVATSEKEVSDCNLAVRNGWYKVTGNASNAPWTLSSWMRVDAYNENYLVQTIYNEANGGRMAQRLKAGTWGSWVNNSPTDFAPSGYGLGVTAYINTPSITTIAQLDTATKCGWRACAFGDGGSAFSIFGMTIWNAVLVVSSYVDSRLCQEMYATEQGVKLVRWCYNGTWTEWGCENPPMVAGVEYRTTERVGDRPVYAYLFNYGYYSTATTTIPHNLTVYQPVSIDITNNLQELLTNSSGMKELSFNRTNINISCDWNMGNVHFIMKYTK